MPTHIALLRGINLGGHKIVKMERLRSMFESLGFARVRTYIQSGNVIFEAGRISPSVLSNRIEKKIQSEFGFPVAVISKTSEEMGKAIESNPFLKEKDIDVSKLHVTFLWQVPAQADLKKLEALATAPDRFRCLHTEVYLYCPNGYGETKLANNTLAKLLGSGATTRNWKTVNKLYQISLE
jgi:uncharacterized protein (DUF1697 family)